MNGRGNQAAAPCRGKQVGPATAATVPARGLHFRGVKAMSTTTATARARQRKPRTKPSRSIRLLLPIGEQSPGVVRIAVGKEAADYFLTALPADFGRGFTVEKIGGEDRYAVNLDGDRRSCECQGFGRWQRCKHADGLAALVAAGRL